MVRPAIRSLGLSPPSSSGMTDPGPLSRVALFSFSHVMDSNSNILVHTASSLPSGPSLQFLEKRILTSLVVHGASSPSQQKPTAGSLATHQNVSKQRGSGAEEWWAALSQCNRESPVSQHLFTPKPLNHTSKHQPCRAKTSTRTGAESRRAKRGLPGATSLLRSSLGPP